MSHYVVGVILEQNQSLQDAMAPYDCRLKEEVPYVYKTKDEAFQYLSTTAVKLKKVNKLTERNYRQTALWYYHDCKALQKDANDLAQFQDLIDKDGNILIDDNRNAKYDWYTVGGRWSGYLKSKDGLLCDVAKIKEVDFSPDQKQFESAKRFWEVAVEGDQIKEELGEKQDDFFTPYNIQYYIEKYGDKEFYAKACSLNTFYALLHNGEWIEKGSMSYFGLDDATRQSVEEYIQKADQILKDPQNQEKVIVVVDCHI
jgi:hypothetical protein